MFQAAAFKKIILLICCSGLLCAADVPAFVVQSFAWAKMVYTFAHEDTLSKAVEKTFDGKHRCKICQSLLQMRAQKHSFKALLSEYHVEEWMPLADLVVRPRLEFGTRYRLFNISYSLSVYFSPPTPPPRLF